MKIAFYDSSLTDGQWQVLEPMLQKPRRTGRPPIDRRKIIDAILYIVKGGVQWRLLPNDFPRWKTVYHVFRAWTLDHTWEALNARFASSRVVRKSAAAALLRIAGQGRVVRRGSCREGVFAKIGRVNPLQLLLVCLAGWINRHQQFVIEYLQEEVKVLREQLGKKPRFTDDQRCRLAAKAQKIGRDALRRVGSIVSPKTLLEWHRRLIARKYDGSRRRSPGRPGTAGEIRELILKLAKENRTWGYTRIQEALLLSLRRLWKALGLRRSVYLLVRRT